MKSHIFSQLERSGGPKFGQKTSTNKNHDLTLGGDMSGRRIVAWPLPADRIVRTDPGAVWHVPGTEDCHRNLRKNRKNLKKNMNNLKKNRRNLKKNRRNLKKNRKNIKKDRRNLKKFVSSYQITLHIV